MRIPSTLPTDCNAERRSEPAHNALRQGAEKAERKGNFHSAPTLLHVPVTETFGIYAAKASACAANEVVGTIVSSSESSIESRTIRKLQIRLLPFLFLLYVVAFIDRINIGFAALTMNKEMAITSQQFGFAAGVFFFGYFLFEVPSNLLLHKIGARIWITRILITRGILATLTGFVHTVHQLYVVRFLLGIAEAGYFPGIVLYLSRLARTNLTDLCSQALSVS